MNRNKKGFTVAELVLVLVIIGIVAAIAVPIAKKKLEKIDSLQAFMGYEYMKSLADVIQPDPRPLGYKFPEGDNCPSVCDCDYWKAKGQCVRISTNCNNLPVTDSNPKNEEEYNSVNKGESTNGVENNFRKVESNYSFNIATVFPDAAAAYPDYQVNNLFDKVLTYASYGFKADGVSFNVPDINGATTYRSNFPDDSPYDVGMSYSEFNYHTDSEFEINTTDPLNSFFKFSSLSATFSGWYLQYSELNAPYTALSTKNVTFRKCTGCTANIHKASRDTVHNGPNHSVLGTAAPTLTHVGNEPENSFTNALVYYAIHPSGVKSNVRYKYYPNGADCVNNLGNPGHNYYFNSLNPLDMLIDNSGQYTSKYANYCNASDDGVLLSNQIAPTLLLQIFQSNQTSDYHGYFTFTTLFSSENQIRKNQYSNVSNLQPTNYSTLDDYGKALYNAFGISMENDPLYKLVPKFGDIDGTVSNRFKCLANGGACETLVDDYKFDTDTNNAYSESLLGLHPYSYGWSTSDINQQQNAPYEDTNDGIFKAFKLWLTGGRQETMGGTTTEYYPDPTKFLVFKHIAEWFNRVDVPPYNIVIKLNDSSYLRFFNMHGKLYGRYYDTPENSLTYSLSESSATQMKDAVYCPNNTFYDDIPDQCKEDGAMKHFSYWVQSTGAKHIGTTHERGVAHHNSTPPNNNDAYNVCHNPYYDKEIMAYRAKDNN